MKLTEEQAKTLKDEGYFVHSVRLEVERFGLLYTFQAEITTKTHRHAVLAKDLRGLMRGIALACNASNRSNRFGSLKG